MDQNIKPSIDPKKITHEVSPDITALARSPTVTVNVGRRNDPGFSLSAI
jgi:hypothetical protein